MDKLKEIIRKKLAEMNATNVGGATAVPGEGIGMATKYAFKGGKDNVYVKQYKYKLVPKKIKGSGLEVKQLWEDETLNEMNDVQKKRIAALDEIEKILNELGPLVSNAKNETIELYGGNAGSYDINKPIEIVLSYLKEIKQLLSEQ